jgi:hypothetical protein
VVDRVDNFPPGYGQYIRIRHEWPDGHIYITWYGHLSRMDVKIGDFVAAGQRIGVAGNTGNSFGIHLHLTLQHLGHGLANYVVDDVIDPEPLIRFGPPPAVNECVFLADVTVPDGTILQPGQVFPKTWRVRNGGTTAWTSGFGLAFFDGEQLGGPAQTPLPPLQPGEIGTVTVNLTAPSRSGRFRSGWKPRSPEGNVFEFELFTEIVVGSPQQDAALFLADVTIPDGTQMVPDQTFLKTWRVRNTGATTWGSTYQLAFLANDQMGAPGSLQIPFTRPGQEAELSVTLRAPVTPGVHQTSWQLRNGNGQPFGDPLFALIQVVRESKPIEGVDEMSYVDDVTIADGTQVQAGQVIEKIWRVRNTGTTAWKTGYEMAFFGDERMGGPESFPLPAAQPGKTVDLVVSLTAPSAPGFHRTTWKPRRPDGGTFEHEMFAEIEVVRIASAAEVLDDAKFVQDVTIPDGTVKQAGETFLKTWQMRNTGTSTWGPGYELVFVDDVEMGDGTPVPLPPAEPGQEVNVSVRLVAPLVPGSHKNTWRPRNPQGEQFGHFFFTLISVPTPVTPAGVNHKASFIGHETLRPSVVVVPGEAVEKIWRVRNTGSTTWGEGFSLAFIEGFRLGGPKSVPVPAAEPLKTVRLTLPLQMPEAPGRYRSFWKLRDPQGNAFGPRLIVSVIVRS